LKKDKINRAKKSLRKIACSLRQGNIISSSHNQRNGNQTIKIVIPVQV
jgi:hypothetical protein